MVFTLFVLASAFVAVAMAQSCDSLQAKCIDTEVPACKAVAVANETSVCPCGFAALTCVSGASKCQSNETTLAAVRAVFNSSLCTIPSAAALPSVGGACSLSGANLCTSNFAICGLEAIGTPGVCGSCLSDLKTCLQSFKCEGNTVARIRYAVSEQTFKCGVTFAALFPAPTTAAPPTTVPVTTTRAATASMCTDDQRRADEAKFLQLTKDDSTCRSAASDLCPCFAKSLPALVAAKCTPTFAFELDTAVKNCMALNCGAICSASGLPAAPATPAARPGCPLTAAQESAGRDAAASLDVCALNAKSAKDLCFDCCLKFQTAVPAEQRTCMSAASIFKMTDDECDAACKPFVQSTTAPQQTDTNSAPSTFLAIVIVILVCVLNLNLHF
jgi:hypothetical protein